MIPQILNDTAEHVHQCSIWVGTTKLCKSCIYFYIFTSQELVV